jgi:glycosyltransferase involved in cell wall biosynthesis
MKKVAILVSQYNSGQWIEQKIHNLLESTIADDLEIICINADSPDPLDDEVPKRYKQIKYIKCPTRIGIYEAWNLGIKESTSPYIANANTDDLVAPHCYGSLADVLDRRPVVDVSYCSWYTVGPETRSWKQTTGKAADGHPGVYVGNFDTGQVGHFPMWRRTLHDKIGMFTDKLPSLGDAEFWARAYYKGNSVFNWIRDPLGAYQWRDGENAWHSYMTDDQWPILNELIAKHKNESNRH